MLALVFFFGALLPAWAALELTEVFGSAQVSRDLNVVQSQSFGPFGGVAVAEVGRTRAVQTGSGINAVNAEGRLDDIRIFFLDAVTEIEQTVKNTGNFDEDLSFHFLINGGELRLFSPSGNFDSQRANVEVVISAFGFHSGPGGFLWWWRASLEGDPFSGQVTLSSELVSDDLGLGAPAMSTIEIDNGEASVGIGAFPAVIDLGTLGSDASTTVSYDMFASVSGPGLNRQGGRASLGDPFDITGNPGSIVSIPGASPVNAVPEPGAWSLVLIGVAVLHVSKRKIGVAPGAAK